MSTFIIILLCIVAVPVLWLLFCGFMMAMYVGLFVYPLTKFCWEHMTLAISRAYRGLPTVAVEAKAANRAAVTKEGIPVWIPLFVANIWVRGFRFYDGIDRVLAQTRKALRLG